MAMRVTRALISSWMRARPVGLPESLVPVLAETAPLPPQDGVGSHDHQGLFPPGPDSGQPDPERGDQSCVVAVASLFACRRRAGGARRDSRERAGGGRSTRREESKQVEQEDDHRARIVSGSKLTVQPPDRRTEFGEAQVPNEPPATAQDRRAARPACPVLYPATRRKLLDGEPLSADSPGHRAAHVAPEVITSPTE